MAKIEWGTKRTCYGCTSSFYDMRKSPATCPKCLTVYDYAALKKPIDIEPSSIGADPENDFDLHFSEEERKTLNETPKGLMEDLEELDGPTDATNYLK